MTDIPIADWDNEVYVAPTGQPNQSRFVPFDEVLTNIERYSIELLVDVKMPPRGSIEALDLEAVLREALMKRAREWNDRGLDEEVMADLSPQLIGLEGRVVHVKDLHGDERQVRIERWERDDHPPVHIEVNMGARTIAHREYESVEVVK